MRKDYTWTLLIPFALVLGVVILATGATYHWDIIPVRGLYVADTGDSDYLHADRGWFDSCANTTDTETITSDWTFAANPVCTGTLTVEDITCSGTLTVSFAADDLSDVSTSGASNYDLLRYYSSTWEPVSGVYIKDDGDVGIGTASPDALFHASLGDDGIPSIDADTVALFSNTDSSFDDAEITIMSGSNAYAILNFGDYNNEDAGYINYRHWTARFTFESDENVFNGNVGVSGAVPDDALDVSGTVDSTGGYEVDNTTVIDGDGNGMFEDCDATTYTITAADQSITAQSDTIDPASSLVRVSLDAPYTMSSTPTMWAPTLAGSEVPVVRICNVSANAITLQDEGTLAGSNLQLTGNTITLNQYESLELMYTNSYWIEQGY